ncbi:uncharacterized protein LOC125016954 isoform X2 [Mugil cephalus]|uniref:uncharacterized protein LOC125016954 isoform X2 n=1 Tax=Mugil cephalus TaxID=48193 RepID=UPI001FB64D8F|nr:uncharacterized protein LOC125016954 isoform X2 [Mugil cephalus]
MKGVTVTLTLLMALTALGNPVQISRPGTVTAGYSTTFTCSSSCFHCIYSWSLSGQRIKGSTFTWTPDGLDDEVKLGCTVINPETGAFHSTSTTVEIKNRMSVQTSPPNTAPSVNQSLNLLCHDATSGDPKAPSDVAWSKDGQRVTLRDNMQLLQDNLTLHFDSVLPSDAGFYHCHMYLPTLKTRVFSLGYLLNFDPWNVSISGPDTVFPDTLSQFTCLTSCALNVECTVRWEFRGGFPLGNFFSVNENSLKWTPSKPGLFQNFTCIAENAAAGRSAEATKMVEVTGILASGS